MSWTAPLTVSAYRSSTAMADCSSAIPDRCRLPGEPHHQPGGRCLGSRDGQLHSGPLVSSVAVDLVRIVAEAEPRIPEPWRPLPEVDAAVLGVGGPVYWGTHGFALRLTAMVASLEPLAGRGTPLRFRANGDGRPGPAGRVTTPESSYARTAPRRSVGHLASDRSSSRVSRTTERFCAGWGGPGGVAGDPLAAAVGRLMFHVKHDASAVGRMLRLSSRRVSSEPLRGKLEAYV